MRIRSKRVLSSILLVLMPAVLEAQDQRIRQGLPAPVPFDASTGYERHYNYDYATGEITRIALPPRGIVLTKPGLSHQDAGQVELCFDNLEPAFTYTSTPATHQELVDWGIKSCGFRCRVTSFTFRYRTPLASPSLSISFYLGTTGFGNLGTQIQRYSFQGLPPGDPFLNVMANTITVDISSNPMCLPDGPIGWGFTNDDLATGVFLSRSPWPTGIIDALDVYDNPPATNGDYTGTFNFSSQGNGQVASLQLQLEEEDDPTLAGIQLVQGSGANPIALIPRSVPAQGTSWIASPIFELVPGSTQSTFILSAGPLPPFPTVAGEVLVDIFSTPLLVDTTSSFHRLDIPVSLAFGQTFFGQAILFGGGTLQLTNGLNLLIGVQ